LAAVAVGAFAYAAQDAPPESRGGVPWLWIVAGGLLGLAGSAFFNFLDNAVFSLDSDEIENLERGMQAADRRLTRLREDMDRSWFALLAGALLFNLLFGLSVGVAVAALVGRFSPLSAFLALVCAVIAVLVFGEVLPGLLATRWRKSHAYAAARQVQICSWFLSPLFLPPLALLRLFSRLTGLNTEERKRAVETEKRLLAMIGLGKVDVGLEEEEREMIDHALEFSESTARDIMTPRGKIAAFENSISQEEALRFLKEVNRGRVLVYDRSLDNVVGVVHAKQLLLNPETDYHQLIDPPLLALEDMELFELMSLMKKHRRQLAVVMDEYGSTAGIVSMNNLLAALVGPISEGEGTPPRKGTAE
jgi:CBS domain containing-hemolysin-like protein